LSAAADDPEPRRAASDATSVTATAATVPETSARRIAGECA
jgi:hypothetical protein